jgi:predicted small metal-binding protein
LRALNPPTRRGQRDAPPVKVDAQNDDEATNKIMAVGKVHMKDAHSNMPAMSEQQMKDMLKAGMKKE